MHDFQVLFPIFTEKQKIKWVRACVYIKLPDLYKILGPNIVEPELFKAANLVT